MEFTSVCWKPVWQALEGNFDLILVNPYQVKNLPGRETHALDMRMALSGRITDHQRFLPGELMDDLKTAEAKIQRVEKSGSRSAGLCSL